VRRVPHADPKSEKVIQFGRKFFRRAERAAIFSAPQAKILARATINMINVCISGPFEGFSPQMANPKSQQVGVAARSALVTCVGFAHSD